MSISHVKGLFHQARIWWDQFRWRLARITLPTWFILGVAFLIASLLLSGLFTLFPYADRQSMESALRIIASTLATFVGFILVVLALITGRASDAREYLEAVAPTYKDVNEFTKVRLDYFNALPSVSCSLDERPMLGPYPRRSPYTYREIYAAVESIYLNLLRPFGEPGWKNVVMGLSHRGFSPNEIDRVLEKAGIFDWQPHEFFRALRKVLQLERAYIGQSDEGPCYLPSHGFLTNLREKWESDRISASLNRVERHERATGPRFWATIFFSVVGLAGSVLLALGLTDVTAQMATIRIGFVGVAIAWCVAIVLIIAYLTQLL